MRLPAFAAEIARLRDQGLKPGGDVIITDTFALARFMRKHADEYAIVCRPGVEYRLDFLDGLDVIIVYADEALLDLADRLTLQGFACASIRTMPYEQWRDLTAQFVAGCRALTPCPPTTTKLTPTQPNGFLTGDDITHCSNTTCSGE